MCYLKPVPDKFGHAFLLTSGANREKQFDDFYQITVGLTSEGRVITKEKLTIADKSDYTPRNAHCSVSTPDQKVLIFGGQDSEKFTQFNELYEFDPSTKSLKHIEANPGDVVPAKRNSHTMVAKEDKAYLFGGANSDGPLKDLFELDLKTYKFKKLDINDKDCPLPMLEMHTCHIYQGNKLLLVGGRALEIGEELDKVMFSD